MDRYSNIRGGSALWSDESLASTIINNEFFGTSTPGPASIFFVKVAGVWKQAVAWIKVSGVWKTATPKININNIWK
jgi:hypothetical protein